MAEQHARQTDQAEIGDHIPVPLFQDLVANDARVLARPADQELGLGPFVDRAALASDFLGHGGRMTQRKEHTIDLAQGLPESGR